ncbi:Cdsp32p protein [Pycnococcus provasolii]|uniref:Cdsp32p protein n=1 Tax=Pycnococcus provasolii TaxID=41880 RepID=A0A830HLP5_9CHLO|nr:Cdsp32p protein [Pycnococcus provasolii]
MQNIPELNSVVERRTRETARVNERAKTVSSKVEFDAAMTLAEDKLVIVEVYSQDECDVGDPESWGAAPTFNTSSEAHDALMEPCARLHSTISRVARECGDVEFVLLDVGDAETKALAAELNVSTIPTVQFWRGGQMIHEAKGAPGAMAAVPEGALYFGDQMAGGADASEYVEAIKSQQDLNDFINRCDLPQEGIRGVQLQVPCEKQLAVLDVSQLNGCENCMHIYPAVVALAKNTAGAVRWSRLLLDESAEAKSVAQSLNANATPTFVFWVGGREVGRISTADRAVLMQAVLETQQKFGVPLPQPPPRKRMSTAEAKEIARQKREQQKKSAW